MPQTPTDDNEVNGELCDDLRYLLWHRIVREALEGMPDDMRADAILHTTHIIAHHRHDELEDLTTQLERARRSCAREWRFVEVREGARIIGNEKVEGMLKNG